MVVKIVAISAVALILLIALIVGLVKGFTKTKTWATEYLFAVILSVLIYSLADLSGMKAWLAFALKIGTAVVFILVFALLSSRGKALIENCIANARKRSYYEQYGEREENVLQILDDYNARMEADGAEDKVITYTDIVGTLMSSVTTIVDMISYVLIAFVAISLVVSSIMIGVITYISVLERKKEIGILRAIGASKGDISRVFNAETVIEGLVAGLLGVGITALCCIPASALVYALFDVPDVAQLPWQAAVVLVLISVFLTFIAGIIPASSASRKDPVEALRSE